MKSLVLVASLLAASVGISDDVFAQRIGDWYTDMTLDTPISFTLNDSENMLGQLCDPSDGNCIYFLGMQTRCKTDSRYPVLINSDSGAWSMEVFCRGPSKDGTIYRYALGDFKAFDSIVRNSERLGIAVPLEGDQFRVFRFSLRGAVSSIDSMRSAAENATTRTKRRGKSTRDEVL